MAWYKFLSKKNFSLVVFNPSNDTYYTTVLEDEEELFDFVYRCMEKNREDEDVIDALQTIRNCEDYLEDICGFELLEADRELKEALTDNFRMGTWAKESKVHRYIA